MTVNKIADVLDLPKNTSTRNIAARAVRHKCPGGAELIDMKEWLSGIGNFSNSDTNAKLSADAFERINQIQIAMLADLEIRYRLPGGCLVNRIRAKKPEGSE